MIDDISLEILRILQEKARIPNVEVSRQVGLAPSAVLERIRKMEKQGVIDGYEVRLNPRRFASSQIAFVQVTVREQPEGPNIGEQLARIPEIQEVHYIAGEDCYLIKIRAADTVELGRLLRTRVTAIPGVLATRTAPVLATYKETARIPIP
jgi:Lrp/AsnC family transcriptional regulator, leucine-responsive regulatory protein